MLHLCNLLKIDQYIPHKVRYWYSIYNNNTDTPLRVLDYSLMIPLSMYHTQNNTSLLSTEDNTPICNKTPCIEYCYPAGKSKVQRRFDVDFPTLFDVFRRRIKTVEISTSIPRRKSVENLRIIRRRKCPLDTYYRCTTYWYLLKMTYPCTKRLS